MDSRSKKPSRGRNHARQGAQLTSLEGRRARLRGEKSRRAYQYRRDLGYQTNPNVDQLLQSVLVPFDAQEVIGTYLDEGEGRVALHAAEREEEVAIREQQSIRQAEEEERQTSVIREIIASFQRTQPQHRSPSAKSSSDSSSASPSRPGSQAPGPQAGPSGGFAPTSSGSSSEQIIVARRKRQESDSRVHMGPPDVNPEFPDGVVTEYNAQRTTASPPDSQVHNYVMISSTRNDNSSFSGGSGPQSKHGSIEKRTGSLDRQHQAAEHIRLPQDIADPGSVGSPDGQTRLRGGDGSLNDSYPRLDPRLAQHIAPGSKVDETQRNIELYFFYHERGKVCAGKPHRYTSFNEDRNDKHLIRLLLRQYDRIRRKNQPLFSRILSLKTIGFVNLLRFEALKNSSNYRLSAKRGIFEYIDSRSSSRFVYILRYGPSKHSRTWTRNLDVLIATASHQDTEGAPIIAVELVESFNTRKILWLISFAIISSMLFGAIAGSSSKSIGNGLAVSGYILSCLGSILTIGGAGTWVGLTRPDSFSFAYDIDEKSVTVGFSHESIDISHVIQHQLRSFLLLWQQMQNLSVHSRIVALRLIYW